MKYELERLPYATNALEPVMDEKTVEIHYYKHHSAYLNNLNAALEGVNLPYDTIEKLLLNLGELPLALQQTVRNNGGGYYNHTLFWKMLTPNGTLAPSGELLAAIERDFGSFEQFKKAFEDAGLKRFGSGWVWLVRTPSGALKIVTTANQDTPLSEGEILLGVDVWEHAYYLKYQNLRAQYLRNIWQIINWDYVAQRFES